MSQQSHGNNIKFKDEGGEGRRVRKQEERERNRDSINKSSRRALEEFWNLKKSLKKFDNQILEKFNFQKYVKVWNYKIR